MNIITEGYSFILAHTALLKCIKLKTIPYLYTTCPSGQTGFTVSAVNSLVTAAFARWFLGVNL